MFDEDFPYASLEDTELAYRLEKKGLKIILNRRAVTYHYHPTTVESFRHRMKLAGVSSTVMVKKHPELVSIFLPVRNISCAKMISGILKKSAFIKRINRKLYWDFQIIASYIEGYMEGLEETGSTHRGSKNS